MDEAKYMLKIKITPKSIQKCFFLCVEKIHFKIMIFRMMDFKMLLRVVIVSQMLSKCMTMMTTYILNYGPIFVFIAASSQAVLKKKKISIHITLIHKVITVVFRRCLYFLTWGSIGDCYEYKNWTIVQYISCHHGHALW